MRTEALASNPLLERPVRALAARAKAIGRAARVKPTALIIVVPDEFAAEPLELGGSVRGAVLVGGLVQYRDTYRLCYIRGPEGILIGLAQELGQQTSRANPMR